MRDERTCPHCGKRFGSAAGLMGHSKAHKRRSGIDVETVEERSERLSNRSSERSRLKRSLHCSSECIPPELFVAHDHLVRLLASWKPFQDSPEQRQVLALFGKDAAREERMWREVCDLLGGVLKAVTSMLSAGQVDRPPLVDSYETIVNVRTWYEKRNWGQLVEFDSEAKDGGGISPEGEAYQLLDEIVVSLRRILSGPLQEEGPEE